MTDGSGGRGTPPPTGGLPDFQQGSAPTLPDYSAQGAPTGLHQPSERSRHRTLAIMLSVVGASVVLLAVVALVLSQTVFRSVLDPQEQPPYATGERSAEGQTEYVPDPEDPDIAPPPPIFTQEPTTECTVPASESAAAAAPGTIRGGDLQYTIPDSWDFPWGSSSLPYMTEVSGQGRNVEDGWYSVVSLGKAAWPEDEGGFPGLEPAAVAVFQCYATTAGVVSHFGESPEVTDYRSEATTVDGHPAWIVQATYHFEDPDMLETSSASVVTSIVVEGPDGASVLASDVAADKPEHTQELEEIIASLEVVA